MAEYQIRDEIRTFIIEDLFEDSERGDLAFDTPLLTGLLDSWGLLQLVNFLEERYGFSIRHYEVVDDNFGSIDTVSRFVQEKLAG